MNGNERREHRDLLIRAHQAVEQAQFMLGREDPGVEDLAVELMKDNDKPIEVEGVEQKMVDAAVEAVVNLITATLKSTSKGRFAEAARLCQIGQQLMRTQAKSVKDFAMLEVADEDNEAVNVGGGNLILGGGNQFAQALHVARAEDAGRDPAARRAALALEPAAQVEREANAAAIATNEATELEKLISLRDRLPEAQRGAIETRIQTLIQSVETRNNAHVQMVPADVPRGHSAGEGGAEGDPGAGVRADGAGGGRANGAAHARPQEGAPQEAVG